MFELKITANSYDELRSKLQSMLTDFGKQTDPVPMTFNPMVSDKPDRGELMDPVPPPVHAADISASKAWEKTTSTSEDEEVPAPTPNAMPVEKSKRTRRTKKELEEVAQPVPAVEVASPAPVLSIAPPPVAAAASIVPPASLAVPKPTAKHAHNFDSFKGSVMSTMSSLVTEGKITQEYINQLKEYFGVQEIWQVFKNEAQLKELYDNFVAAGFIQAVG